MAGKLKSLTKAELLKVTKKKIKKLEKCEKANAAWEHKLKRKQKDIDALHKENDFLSKTRLQLTKDTANLKKKVNDLKKKEQLNKNLEQSAQKTNENNPKFQKLEEELIQKQKYVKTLTIKVRELEKKYKALQKKLNDYTKTHVKQSTFVEMQKDLKSSIEKIKLEHEKEISILMEQREEEITKINNANENKSKLAMEKEKQKFSALEQKLEDYELEVQAQNSQHEDDVAHVQRQFEEKLKKQKSHSKQEISTYASKVLELEEKLKKEEAIRKKLESRQRSNAIHATIPKKKTYSSIKKSPRAHKIPIKVSQYANPTIQCHSPKSTSVSTPVPSPSVSPKPKIRKYKVEHVVPKTYPRLDLATMRKCKKKKKSLQHISDTSSSSSEIQEVAENLETQEKQKSPMKISTSEVKTVLNLLSETKVKSVLNLMSETKANVKTTSVKKASTSKSSSSSELQVSDDFQFAMRLNSESNNRRSTRLEGNRKRKRDDSSPSSSQKAAKKSKKEKYDPKFPSTDYKKKTSNDKSAKELKPTWLHRTIHIKENGKVYVAKIKGIIPDKQSIIASYSNGQTQTFRANDKSWSFEKQNNSSSNEGFYEISKILQQRYDTNRRKRLYKVRWKNYGHKFDSWVTQDDITDEAVKEWQKLNTNKRKPQNDYIYRGGNKNNKKRRFSYGI